MVVKTKNVAKLKKEADTWFSRYIRYRDGWYNGQEWLGDCITCGVIKPIKQLQAGHFVSRVKNILRYDELNVHAQCTGCNMFKAGEQYLYSKEIDKRYGDGTAQELMNQRFQTHKLMIPELEQIIHDAKEYIKHCETYPENYRK